MPRKTKVNHITSAEKTALINKNNLRLKNDFLAYLKSIQRSEGTINGYDNDLLILFTYIMENLGNKDFQKLTKRDIVSLQNWLVNNGNSPARIRRIKSAISSLSNYCEDILSDDEPEFYGYRSTVKKIGNPTLQPVRDKTVWSDEELDSLLSTLLERMQYEKACFVALAMYSGRRKAELCRFKMSDFSEDKIVCDGALYKSSPILTKGQKYLECYTLTKKFTPYLNLWIQYREKNNIESEWLFPNKNNPKEHISISTINSWAISLSNISKKDFYFHSLRHYYCSALIRAGIPDNVIVMIVGWTTAEMLKIYNDNPKDDQIAMYFKDGDIATPNQKGFEDM